MLRCCCRWLKVCLWFLCDNFCNSATVNIFSTYLLSTYLCVCVYIYWYECMRYSWHYCCCYCQLTVVDDMYVANIWTRSSANKASAGNISKTKNRIINMAYFLNLYLLYRKRVIVRASIRPCMQSYLYLYMCACMSEGQLPIVLWLYCLIFPIHFLSYIALQQRSLHNITNGECVMCQQSVSTATANSQKFSSTSTINWKR